MELGKCVERSEKKRKRMQKMSPKVSKHDERQEESSQGPLIRSLCKQIYDANEFAAEWVESPKRERVGEKKKKKLYCQSGT